MRLGIQAKRILTPEQLSTITHLVIPGGESTVMSKFLKNAPIKQMLIDRAVSGQLSIFGTCAGAILISKNVHPPEKVENMGLIDIDTDRNAYGSQLHSFEEAVEFLPKKQEILATFIRAPKITRVGGEVEVLASHNNQPILVRQKNILAATFHPEYLEEPIIHNYFLQMNKK